MRPPPPAGSGAPSTPQIRENGKDAAIVFRRLLDPQLREGATDVRLDRLRAEPQRTTDALVRPTLGHQRHDLPLAAGECLQRIDATALCEQLVDNGSVDHALTGGYSLHRLDELLHASDTLLQEIAESLRPLFDEPESVVGLELLREDENRGLRMTRTDLACRAHAFIRVGWRHADVDERHIGTRVAHAREQCVRVCD